MWWVQSPQSHGSSPDTAGNTCPSPASLFSDIRQNAKIFPCPEPSLRRYQHGQSNTNPLESWVENVCSHAYLPYTVCTWYAQDIPKNPLLRARLWKDILVATFLSIPCDFSIVFLSKLCSFFCGWVKLCLLIRHVQESLLLAVTGVNVTRARETWGKSIRTKWQGGRGSKLTCELVFAQVKSLLSSFRTNHSTNSYIFCTYSCTWGCCTSRSRRKKKTSRKTVKAGHSN